jgi:hypothetical protein
MRQLAGEGILAVDRLVQMAEKILAIRLIEIEE